MSKVKRSYAATETVVQWVLGTKPGGKYLQMATLDGDLGFEPDLADNREAAKPFLSEASAEEFRALRVPKDMAAKLRVIRRSHTVRESCDG